MLAAVLLAALVAAPVSTVALFAARFCALGEALLDGSLVAC